MEIKSPIKLLLASMNARQSLLYGIDSKNLLLIRAVFNRSSVKFISYPLDQNQLSG